MGILIIYLVSLLVLTVIGAFMIPSKGKGRFWLMEQDEKRKK